ncbi:DUF3040 domain-containing protein [Arthrobacter sp. AET 35A]|uniref:DUF3040 domain-containing protein n=1 Tax=Arthrobacter sp. AET 35A TaxID=2292643 RepID=UPI001CE26438|nr:DUF3040 domain-containing protein [Arthrobacter sp. AET 35A]MBE0011541.1 DUF3040 domain-containing protein [Arthrobacter sp. AET 35A]
MPLSDEERSRFDELARRLAAEEPELAQRLQHTISPRRTSRRRKAAFVTILGGILIVLLSIAVSIPVVGIAGFLTMIAGGIVGTPPPPPEQRDTSPPGPTRPSGPQSSTKPL